MKPPPGRLGELARLFTRLGFTAFGGPAAHIAIMREEVVDRRRWLTNERYTDLLGITNLIPGPNSTEMAMQIGRERAGWRGLVLAGACFILPAVSIVLLLGWLYVRYGARPEAQDLLVGIKPVTLVIIGQALAKLVPAAAKTWLTRGVSVGALVAYLAGANELLILLVSAVLVWSERRVARGRPGLMPIAILSVVSEVSERPGLGRLFLVFLKVGGLLYGSGYVLVAFLRGDLVERLGVLTEQQLLDAVSIGQVTPGPLFTTATFVGYVLHGLAGALLATVAIFLPGFVFVAAIGPLADRVRDRPSTRALLDGVNAGALGLMAAVLWYLGKDSFNHWLEFVLAGAAALALGRTKVNSAWLVTAGAAAGLVAGRVGLLG